jgi:hypothetical protein
MYATLDVAEQIEMGRLYKHCRKNNQSSFYCSRIKIQSSLVPYRVGPAMDEHLEVCRDLNFWQKYIDAMAENRFNILSLWNVHPFSFMVKPVNFPRQ